MTLLIVVPEPRPPEAAAAPVRRGPLAQSVAAAIRAVRGRVPPEDRTAVLDFSEDFGKLYERCRADGADPVDAFLDDAKLRHELRDRVAGAIGPGSAVVVGHGLGTLIAYEGLCVAAEASVSFVTLGAVLCGPEDVFDRLEPPPRDGQGQWPAAVRQWVNLVAVGDPRTGEAPRLSDRFGQGIEDGVVELRGAVYDLGAYLVDRSVGLAVSAGIDRAQAAP